MKDFKKGIYLFLLGLGMMVGLLASNALDEGNTKLAGQILMTWVGVFGIAISLIGGFLYAIRRKS